MGFLHFPKYIYVHDIRDLIGKFVFELDIISFQSGKLINVDIYIQYVSETVEVDRISNNNDEFHTDEKITDGSELKEGEDLPPGDETSTEETNFDIDFDDELILELDEDEDVFDEEALSRRLVFMSPIVNYVRAKMADIANTSFYTSGEAKKALIEVADQYLKEMLDALCQELVSIMFLTQRRTIGRGHVAYAMEHVFKLFVNKLWDEHVLNARANLISKIFKVQIEDDNSSKET
jgi:hypothetical protein